MARKETLSSSYNLQKTCLFVDGGVGKKKFSIEKGAIFLVPRHVVQDVIIKGCVLKEKLSRRD